MEELIFKFRWQAVVLLAGLAALGAGLLFANNFSLGKSKIEVLETTTEGQKDNLPLTVEASGSVMNPGVYQLTNGDRVEDLLIAAGGLAGDADREWLEKTLNRAAKLTDGQKIFIPAVNEQSSVLSANALSGSKSGLININSAGAEELESLSGIGQTYAQNIIEGRPYSSVEELVGRKIIPQKTFDKIKDKISVF